MQVISLLSRYIRIMHLSDKSVQWESLVEIYNFKSYKKHGMKRTGKKKRDLTRSSSQSISSDGTTISENTPPIATYFEATVYPIIELIA